MDDKDQERRAAQLARILDTAATVPLDQAGTVLWPPSSYWERLRQRVRCGFGRHAWGRPWLLRQVVPSEHQVSRMLRDGAAWPCEEIRDCACGARARRRVA